MYQDVRGLVLLSGIGLFNDSFFFAPGDPKHHWYYDDYTDPQVKAFYPHSHLMREVKEESIKKEPTAFLLHEACWDIFEETNEQDEKTLARLHQIYMSYPFPPYSIPVHYKSYFPDASSRELLSVFLPRHHTDVFDTVFPIYYPTTDGAGFLQCVSETGYRHVRDDVPAIDCLESNPYYHEEDIEPQIEGLRRSAHDRVDLQPVAPSFCQRHDCFYSLPLELRLDIAELLTTLDVENLCQVSQSFVPVLGMQVFWRSRFSLSGEYGWLHGALKNSSLENVQSYDWRRFYSTLFVGFPSLHVRALVWKFVESLRPALQLQLNSQVSNGLLEAISITDRRAVFYDQTLWGPDPRFFRLRNPLTPLFHCKATIPRQLTEVVVYQVKLGKENFIYGLKVSSLDGENTLLGYSSRSFHNQHVQELNGFLIAMDQGGLKGLKLVTPGGVSKWLGCPDKTAHIRCALSFNDALELRVIFDVSEPPVCSPCYSM